jgi:hypothetical protein
VAVLRSVFLLYEGRHGHPFVHGSACVEWLIMLT